MAPAGDYMFKVNNRNTRKKALNIKGVKLIYI